jgi:phosphatidyl-myo-inositol dimannoside synthase
VARILIISFDLWNSHGGIQRYGRALIEALAKVPGTSLETLVVGGETAESNLLSSDAIKPTIQFTTRLKWLRYTKLILWALFSGSVTQYSVIIVLHARLLPLIYPQLSRAKNTSTRIVVIQHGIEVWQKPSFSQKICQKLVSVAVSVSAFTQQEASKYWWKSEPIKTAIIPGIGLHSLSQGHAFGFNKNAERLLVTVSRLSADDSYKGVDKVLAVLPQLKELCNFRYVVVGDGDDRVRLTAMAKQLGVVDVVDFLGHRSDADISELLERADCFVLPSSGEGLGIATLEALLAGCPVVVGDSDGAQELLVSDSCGKAISPNDKQQLLSAIAELLLSQNDPALRASRRRAVLSEFGADRFQQRWQELLSNLGVGEVSPCVE